MASVWGGASHGDSRADTHRADADSRADTHGADAVRTSERRIAADGQAYTMQEYQEYYGMWWLERWQTAGAVQPGEDGSAASATSAVLLESSQGVKSIASGSGDGEVRVGAVAVGADACSAASVTSPVLVEENTASFPTSGSEARAGGAGAAQPGGDGPAGAGHLGEWREAPFFTTRLPSQHLPGGFCLSTTVRAAIEASCGPLFEHLPLLCSTFCNFDMAERVGETGAVVVAEKVIRIPDGNRPPLCRVDFFCYHAGGAVVRCHPGRNPATTMKPHRMLPGSVLFRKATAWEVGVGAALHAEPPGVVRDAQRALPAAPGPGGDIADALQLGAIVATRQDMDEVCKYDVNMLSWKVVRAKLAALETHDEDRVDWSNGQRFPWWVWLANTGILRDVVNEGVRAVELVVQRGVKSVVVTSVSDRFWLSFHPTNGKLQVWPMPHKCDET